MAYIQIIDFNSKLIEKLDKVDTDLPVFEEHLSKLKSRLGDKNHTYLIIKDGSLNSEIIKVLTQDGKLSIIRGLEQTDATTFPKGACVTHILTSTAVREIVCQMECCPNTE